MYELPRFFRSAALLSLLAASAACSGGGGGGGTTPPPPPTTGTISGTVTRSGTGVDGATIAITGGGSATSGASGGYALSNVAPGAKTLTITPPAGNAIADGEVAVKSATVVAGQTATVNWLLKTAPGGGPTVVNLNAGSFAPDAVTIPVGGTVRWVNVTATAHTITNNTAGQTGAWVSQNIAGNGTAFEHTFAATGVFDYHCNIHAGMTGRVTVN